MALPRQAVRGFVRQGGAMSRMNRGWKTRSWLVLGFAMFSLQLAVIPVHAAKGDGEYKAGQRAEIRQDYDEAFRQYQAAAQADPKNPQFLTALERVRFQAAARHVDRGNKLRNTGILQAATT